MTDTVTILGGGCEVRVGPLSAELRRVIEASEWLTVAELRTERQVEAGARWLARHQGRDPDETTDDGRKVWRLYVRMVRGVLEAADRA